MNILDLKAWGDWFLRTVFVGGVLFWSFFGLLQVGVIDIGITMPTIEKTFKK